MSPRDGSAAATEPNDDALPALPTTRIEHDSMGEVEVPALAKWGAQTQRAVENFPISGLTLEPRLIRALALIKGEAALVNASLKDVPAVTKPIGAAIAAAATEVADGAWNDEFPVDVFQTGSGTSSNMNMNEVLARLASEHLGEAGSVHPNDHVNASQSSNDVHGRGEHVVGGRTTSSPRSRSSRRRCGASSASSRPW
jgi:fumarate hydratase, class II